MKKKYPRTFHFPFSEGKSSDDKTLYDLSAFEGKEVVITTKLDGENCLDADTIVNTEDGNKTIKDIVDNKYYGKVLSYNIDDNEIEYQNIVAHNVSLSTSMDEWFEIELENGKKIEITGNHYVFLPKLNCYRKVIDLKENDDIMFL